MLPERQSSPAENRGARSVTDDTAALEQVTDDLSYLQRQVVLDAVLGTWAGYWERRARSLEAARPVPGDFTGAANREQLSAAWWRLTEAARACRARGQVSPLELFEPAYDDVLSEVA